MGAQVDKEKIRADQAECTADELAAALPGLLTTDSANVDGTSVRFRDLSEILSALGSLRKQSRGRSRSLKVWGDS